MERDVSAAHRATIRGASARPRVFAPLPAMVGTTAAVAAATVPAQFQGRWVPAKATCESAARMMIGADRLTLVNGADTQPLSGVEMAGPGYFPPGYRGIMAVLI